MVRFDTGDTMVLGGAGTYDMPPGSYSYRREKEWYVVRYGKKFNTVFRVVAYDNIGWLWLRENERPLREAPNGPETQA